MVGSLILELLLLTWCFLEIQPVVAGLQGQDLLDLSIQDLSRGHNS